MIGLAHIFFQELARKGKNPVYNILPDVISRLSADTQVRELPITLIP